MSMIKNLFIFREFVFAIFFLLTMSLMLGCSGSSEIKAIAVNQSNGANKKPMNKPTPPKINGNTEIELPDGSKIPTVTYCDLIKNSAGYDRKIVRVRGIYFNGFERMFFYDERCVKGEPPNAPKNIPAETWIQWDTDYVTGRQERLFVVIAAIGKLSFVALLFSYALAGEIPLLTAFSGLGDLFFGVIFAAWLWKTRRSEEF